MWKPPLNRYFLITCLTAFLVIFLGTLNSVKLVASTPQIQQQELLSFSELATLIAQASPQTTSLQLIVNSNQDEIKPDTDLTLREAIEIVNGNLPLEKLSEAENQQISVLEKQEKSASTVTNSSLTNSRIDFNLPAQATTIKLTSTLPPLLSQGLVIDGTTQPGYIENSAVPVVAIAPASGYKIFRGFTVSASGIRLRGLSLYGFSTETAAISNNTAADILISQDLPEQNSKLNSQNIPIKDIVIESNWLGIPPTNEVISEVPASAFGVYVFDTQGLVIQNNRIANHNGSGIITSIQANNLLIKENTLENNGLAGMPDAIRLEGDITSANILSNVIQNNAGSGIYLFKPSGSVSIRNNTIANNGKKLQRAAIYLMGNDHKVTENKINNQAGPGVVVAAYPQSDRNVIQSNQFSGLQGLSIDLVTQQNTDVLDYQKGDGANPPTNSHQRRRKTGNFGIDAPHFISQEFFWSPSQKSVTLIGEALPNSQIEIYQVTENSGVQGPLNQPIATTATDEQGKFTVTLSDLQIEDRVSAIATHPQYGTSEPAVNAVVRQLPQ